MLPSRACVNVILSARSEPASGAHGPPLSEASLRAQPTGLPCAKRACERSPRVPPQDDTQRRNTWEPSGRVAIVLSCAAAPTKRRRSELLPSADLEDLCAADGTGALGRRATILHRDLLGVFDFALGLALHAVAGSHGFAPPWSNSRPRATTDARWAASREDRRSISDPQQASFSKRASGILRRRCAWNAPWAS